MQKQPVHPFARLCIVSTYITFAIKIRPILSDGSYFYALNGMHLYLLDIFFDLLRRHIQYIRMAKQPKKVFDNIGIVEAIADPLIQIELQIQVFPFHDLAIFNLFGAALAAKGAKSRNGTKVIEMMVNRPDT